VWIDLFVWSPRSVEHISRHGVQPDEVDQVLDGDHRTVRTHSGRYLLMGRSSEGRYLVVIFAPLGDGKGLVITARDMTEAERRRFIKLL
jgi:uncharacterized protein